MLPLRHVQYIEHSSYHYIFMNTKPSASASVFKCDTSYAYCNISVLGNRLERSALYSAAIETASATLDVL
jgi:hypothetical protein